MATFLQLKNRVLNNLTDAKPATQNAVSDLIGGALREAQDDRNWRVQEETQDYITSAGTHTLGSMPPGPSPFAFKELDSERRPYYTTAAGVVIPLRILPTLEDAYDRFSPTDLTDKGAPVALVFDVIDGAGTTQVSVFPFSDSLSDYTGASAGQYRITIPYFGYLPDLAADGDTNWFTVRGEFWLENYATALGFMRDWDEQRASSWLTLAAGYYKKLKRHDALKAVAAINTLVPRSDVNAPRDQARGGGSSRGWVFSS